MRRQRAVAIGVLVAAAGLSACSGSTKSSNTSGGAAVASPGLAPAGLATSATTPSGGSGGSGTLGRTISAAQPQIVRTGDVQVQVRHGAIQQAFDRIAGATTGAGGFVADSNMSTGESPSARLVLRLANNQVQPIVAALTGVGRITQQSLKGQDVTGQVVDLAARVTVLQSEADAVRTLLSRAAAIGDILQIQNQLFDLQTQIEQLNGQRATLADQTTWATISVELTEATGGALPPAAARAHQSTLGRSWRLARDNTVQVLRGLAISIGWAAPAIIVMLFVGLPLWLWWRRRPRTSLGN